MSGSGISRAVCKSASRSRQITTPVPHHSVFLPAGTGLDSLPRPTNSVKALKEFRRAVSRQNKYILRSAESAATFSAHTQRRSIGLSARREELAENPPTFRQRAPTNSGAARGEGGSFPPMGGRPKLCNMRVLSLSWNFFVSHDKYIARPSSKEPR